MDLKIRSKLKDIGLLANPFHLYGWLDDNRELCKRHSAPNKIKMDGRVDESILYEDSRGVAQQNSHFLPINHEMEDTISDELDLAVRENTSQFEIQQSQTQASNDETTRVATSSDIDELVAYVSELQRLLAKKEFENKLIKDENRILEVKFRQIQREKEMLDSYTQSTLARNENLHLLELKEYKTQLKNRQDKINATLAENSELKTMLAKQLSENEHLASESANLESRIAQFGTEKEKLQANNQRNTVKANGKHLGVLQECNVLVRQKQDRLYASDRHNRTGPTTNYVNCLNASAKAGY